MKYRSQAGFTIIELLIATSVASVVLLAASFSIIQMSRLYYKGNILSRTQDVTRNITNAISNPIQFEGSEVVHDDTHSSGFSVLCVGYQRFTYRVNALQDDDLTSGVSTDPNGTERRAHAFWADTRTSNDPTQCTPVNLDDETPTAGGSDILGDTMRLGKLEVSPQVGSDDKIWNITVNVLYGERDLMEPQGDLTLPPTGCSLGVTGSQWCAVAEYSTSVFKRL